MDAQTGLKGGVAHPDTNLVALAGVHDTLHVVEPGVEFPLDDGLKIGLHLLAGNLYKGNQCQILLLVKVRSDDGNLVVLNFVHLPHQHQLSGGIFGGPALVVHIGLADDFTLKGSGKGYGDGQLGGLNLDVPQFQRLLHGLIVVAHGFQRTGHLVLAQVNVHHHREAQGNGTGTGRHHNGIDGTEGIDKGGHTVLGVVQQASQVTGLDVAENQSGTDCHGDNVNHGGDIMTQRNDTQLQTHLHAAIGALLDAVTHHKGHDALGLIVLDHLHHIGGVIGFAQHYRHTGDVAGDQGHAQGTNHGVGNEADAALCCIGVAALHILETFDNFSAHSGSKTGIQRLTQILLVGNQAFQNAHAGGQVAQGLHLHAGSGIDGGEEIGGIGEGDFLVSAVFGDGIVDGILGQTGNSVGTAID